MPLWDWFERTVIAVVLSGVLLLAAFPVLISQRQWLPYIFDDGPFKGENVPVPHDRAPDQRFPIRNYSLEIFNSADEVSSPIVVLRDSAQNVKWSVKAHGWKVNDVRRLKFTDYRTILDTTVRGYVEWTFGSEGTWWILGRNGELKGYYYSW